MTTGKFWRKTLKGVLIYCRIESPRGPRHRARTRPRSAPMANARPSTHARAHTHSRGASAPMRGGSGALSRTGHSFFEASRCKQHHRREGVDGLLGLLENGTLLLGRKPPATLDRGDDFDEARVGSVLGHSHSSSPLTSAYFKHPRCPCESGATSGGPSKPLVLIGHIREIGHRIRNRYYLLTIPAVFSGRSHIIVKNASAS